MTVTMMCFALLSFLYYGFCAWKVSPRASILYGWLLLGGYFAVCGFWQELFWFLSPLFFLFWFLFFSFVAAAFLEKKRRCEGDEPPLLVLLGVRNDGTVPESVFRERVALCARLMKEKTEIKAVLCGGRVFGETESEASAMAKALVSQGVSPHRLILEEESRTTAENFARLARLLEDGVSGIGVITSSYHRFRAGLTAKAVLGEMQISFFTSPAPAFFALHLYLREFFTFSVDLFAGRLTAKKK